MSADPRDRQSDLAVMDVEEFTQKRLLKRLIDRREQVDELANEARRQWVVDNIDQQARDTMILFAVKDFISAGWTLLLNHEQSLPADEHSEFLFGRDLGTLTILDQTWEFEGLYDVLASEEVYAARATRTVEYPQGPPRQIAETESKAVPRDISWRACRLMDEFLAEEQGIELKVDQLDDSLESFGFSSADLSEFADEATTLVDMFEDHDVPVDARALNEKYYDFDNAENGEHADS
jgi:hypothetical protein